MGHSNPWPGKCPEDPRKSMIGRSFQAAWCDWLKGRLRPSVYIATHCRPTWHMQFAFRMKPNDFLLYSIYMMYTFCMFTASIRSVRLGTLANPVLAITCIGERVHIFTLRCTSSVMLLSTAIFLTLLQQGCLWNGVIAYIYIHVLENHMEL